LVAPKAAPCDGALIQRGRRLTRLFRNGIGCCGGFTIRVAAFDRL
jgi:hypothetical protein